MPAADEFAKLEVPKEMPAKIVQRIKDLKCPPPLRPSQVKGKIQRLDNMMQAQVEAIKILEDHVNDLEGRYKISFSCETTPKFDLQPSEHPRIDKSGNLTSGIILDFHLWQARAGIEGIPGDQGEQGIRGENSLPGPTGIIGYYGVRGDLK